MNLFLVSYHIGHTHIISVLSVTAKISCCTAEITVQSHYPGERNKKIAPRRG